MVNNMDKKDSEDVKMSVKDFYNVRADSFMCKDLPIVEVSAHIVEVLNRLGELKTDHLWVVDSEKNDNLVGVITEKDILRGLSSPFTNEEMAWDLLGLKSITQGSVKSASDLMRRHLIMIKPDVTFRETIDIMTRNRIRRLPVVKDDKLIGEVNVHQIARQVSKNLLNK